MNLQPLQMDYKTPVSTSWLFKMAWRDSRKNRSRLFLFISSIVLGIAALVAIYSFGDNLERDIDNQAATLIGADLVLSSNKPLEPKAQKLAESFNADRSDERIFASMVLFPKDNGTRLVQIHALQGKFPYYGSLETSPLTAGKTFQEGKNALVDKTLMLQFNAKTGDSIQVGRVVFAIAGTLNKAPGQTGIASSVAPSVYIPLSYLEQTGLSQKGSRITYKFYYSFNDPGQAELIVKKHEKHFDKEELNYDTIKSQKEQTGRSFADLTNFLALVGFIALLLGCIGVASAIHIYIREKLGTIAVLRCLGVKARQAFLIYLIQITAIGLAGALVGSLLGTFIQQALPVVLKDFLPIEINSSISWSAIGQGILLGAIISVLFALLPLISIRRVSPLNTLRMSADTDLAKPDPLKWLVYFLVVLFVYAFTWMQLGSPVTSLVFTVSVFVAFLILAGIAKALMWAIRRFFPTGWSYLWRQGFSNLYRPNNQTTILLVSLGLGTAFICILFFIQGILLDRVNLSSGANQPNMIVFDIQSSQKEKVAVIAKQFKLPIIQQVPIVTIQLTAINGITAIKAKKDSTLHLSPGVFKREYRVTYRDTLSDTEKITDGKWAGTTRKGETPHVSVETGFAKRAHLKVGDKLDFNVQGMPITTIVGSIRQVEWNKVQTNFLIVFPNGVIEDAPQFNVLVTRVPSSEVSAAFQRTMVQNFPNVSVIDLGLILNVLDEILDKIGFVIRFMAGFSIITGLIVLVASVMISKYQRMQESVLLRTLGASRRQILAITALEYLFLGAISALTGITLAMAASWALAHYTFETTFSPDILPVLIILAAVSALTVVIGLFNSRTVVNRPPLEVLRKEV